VAHRCPVEGIEPQTICRWLETVCQCNQAPGLYGNAAKVAALASKLTEEGKDIVLMLHSYSGLVACEASKGLVKSARAKVGKQGGIVWIVFVTAVVGKEGQSLLDMMGDTRLGYITVEACTLHSCGV
jgi:hypothetical protein